MNRLLSLKNPYLQGPDVINLQNNLNKIEYSCGKVDGIFGPSTQKAVIQFQKDNNLDADGIVGPKTQLFTATFEWENRRKIDNNRFLFIFKKV